MNNNNTNDSGKTTGNKPVGKSNRKLPTPHDASPLPPGGSMPEPDMATKLHLAKLLSELMMSGDYEIELPDEFIVGKFADRVARLEARIAELEKAAGKPPVAERANTAALAGKGAK
jgi:hypothetical protein